MTLEQATWSLADAFDVNSLVIFMRISFSFCGLLPSEAKELEVRSFLDTVQQQQSLARSGTRLEASLMFLCGRLAPVTFGFDVHGHQLLEPLGLA
jgi:hypothetical protein